MESKPLNTGKYMGTYPVRTIGHNQCGIHMPIGTTGDYAIFRHTDGRFELVPVGDRDVDYVMFGK